MKKIGSFVLLFIGIILAASFLRNLAYAQELIKPIPDDDYFDEEPFPSPPIIIASSNEAYRPQVSFGQIMNNPPPSNNADNSEKKAYSMATVREFIKRMEEERQRSWEEFNRNNQIISKQDTINSEETESPTPIIPMPTLMATQNNNNLIGDEVSNTGEAGENQRKTSYTIAILGDSMVDTLGRDLPHLKALLSEAFPRYTFTLLNYGFGATDMESGLLRLTNSSRYLETDYPPLLSYKPDVLVIESFAYNHWSGEKYDLDRQWLTIAKIIDKVKEASPETKIILASTIAPNSQTFGDGKLNWNEALKWDSSLITRAYLQNLINFATSQNYPLADAYHPSLGSDGNGLPYYIDQSDHLHPSEAGRRLFSQKIVETIKNNYLLK